MFSKAYYIGFWIIMACLFTAVFALYSGNHPVAVIATGVMWAWVVACLTYKKTHQLSSGTTA